MKIATFLDLTLNEIRNFLFHKVGSDPSTPVEGQAWYNTTTKKFRGQTDAGTIDLGGSTGGGVTSVSGTAPIASSGGAAPAISISPATTGAPGSMSAADKAKLDGIASGAQPGTVTNVTGTAPIVVATGTTTPAVSINPASGSNAGSMSAADKTKLDAATSAATASTIVQRDAQDLWGA